MAEQDREDDGFVGTGNAFKSGKKHMAEHLTRPAVVTLRFSVVAAVAMVWIVR